jgi:predicted DNA-binding protein
MTPLKQTAFRLPSEQIEALQLIKERDGIPISEQVRRAVEVWIVERGGVKAERKRAGTRKRS